MAHAWVMYFGGTVAAMLAMFGLTYSASVAGFMGARFALGLGEAGNFPARSRRWPSGSPRKERAFATGIFNAGTNIGALLTPLIVPVLTLTWGWKRRSSQQAPLDSCGSHCGGCPTVRPRNTRGSARENCAHPERSARADDKDVVGNNPSASPGVDLRCCEVHD